MKRIVRLCTLTAMILMGILMCSQGALAASSKGLQKENGYYYYYKSNGKKKTGWKTISGKTFYFRKKSEGSAPKGSMVTKQFYEIDGKYFYFNKNGVLQTGWKTIRGNNYYFKTKGGAGTLGKMFTGLKTLNGYKYYFAKDGKLQTGWKTIKGDRYFFAKSGKLGVKGRMCTGWVQRSGATYYFSSSGVLQTGWTRVDKQCYYFDKTNGQMQTGWLSLKKGMYYLGTDGARRTGWQTIDGKKYYFYPESGRKGVMAVSTTIDGIQLDENGVAQESYSVLIVAGHGQGDPGATSTMHGTYYQESTYTRQFADLIYNQLNSSGKPVKVTMYDQNYDWYQVNAGKASGPKITWSDYDYILEVHFNATATASKDYNGDNSYKGMGIYVHSSASDMKIDKAIVSTVHAQTGFKIWGGGTGIFYDSSLCNPRLAESNGVPYGLLETCFIDDYDDMSFYQANKSAYAKAVADGIISGLGL